MSRQNLLHGFAHFIKKNVSYAHRYSMYFLRSLLTMCKPLCYILYSSFKSHCLPSQWLSFCHPFSKKGTTSDPANYKPISLTCTCCRVIEHIINTHLIDYLLRKLISRHQHGFLVRYSTCTNLLETVNDWTITLDNHLKIDAICIDFQKAFDSVSRSKLLTKLSSYIIRGDMFALIVAFLDHRSLGYHQQKLI